MRFGFILSYGIGLSLAATVPGFYMSKTEKATSLMNVSTNSSAAISNHDSRPQAQILEGTPSPAKDNSVAARTITPSYFYERPPTVQCRLPVDIVDGVFPQRRGLFPELPDGAWPNWSRFSRPRALGLIRNQIGICKLCNCDDQGNMNPQRDEGWDSAQMRFFCYGDRMVLQCIAFVGNPPRDPNVDIMQYRAAIESIPAIFHEPNNVMAGGWIWWNGGPDENGRYLTLPGGPDHYDRSWVDIVFDGVPIPGTEPPLFFKGADPYGYQPDPGFYGYPSSDEYYWRGAGAGAGGGFGDNGDSGGLLKRGLGPSRSMEGGKLSPRRRMIRGGGRPVNLP
ncbi:hypothetical protein TWF751_011000 [Orbilia oligospora]|nr:hypothetical protein TWF751_011000 [Orbilia oligospora]KAF3230956.1 hypothetical protein TWF128_005080 [Orbilia oligospora]